jgi:hypothetical protein
VSNISAHLFFSMNHVTEVWIKEKKWRKLRQCCCRSYSQTANEWQLSIFRSLISDSQILGLYEALFLACLRQMKATLLFTFA